jgi:hypothetical protein
MMRRGQARLPWIAADDFNPGCLQRGLHLMPKQGGQAPWIFRSDYYTERETLPALDLDEPHLVYSAGRQKLVANA